MTDEAWTFRATRALVARLTASGMEEGQAIESAIVSIRQTLAEQSEWDTPESAADAAYEATADDHRFDWQ